MVHAQNKHLFIFPHLHSKWHKLLLLIGCMENSNPKIGLWAWTISPCKTRPHLFWRNLTKKLAKISWIFYTRKTPKILPIFFVQNSKILPRKDPKKNMLRSCCCCCCCYTSDYPISCTWSSNAWAPCGFVFFFGSWYLSICCSSLSQTPTSQMLTFHKLACTRRLVVLHYVSTDWLWSLNGILES